MKILYPHLKPIRFIFSLLVFFLLSFSLTGQYCTPSKFPYNCDFAQSIYITNVTISNLNKNSPCADAEEGYQDYSASDTVNLYQAVSYTLNVTTQADGNPSGTYYTTMWVDMNANEVYETSERLVLNQVQVVNGTSSFNLTMPSVINEINGRMRVRVSRDQNNQAPCGEYTYSEAEDYSVKFCPAGDNASFLGIDPLVCDGSSENITVSYPNGDSVVDWEYSLSGEDGTWVQTGVSQDSYSTGNITQSRYYRAIIHSSTLNCQAPTLPVFKIYNGADALPENSSICPNDSVILTSTSSPATSFLKNENNVVIPDNGTGVSTININNSLDPIFASTKIKEVCYTVSHQFPQDITNVILRSPSGTNFNFNNNDIIGSFCFDNVQKPGLINSFLGENINGNWQFRISDNVAGGSGLIEEWSIEFETGVKWQSVVGNASDIASPHEFTTNVSNPTFGNKSYSASPVVFDVSCFTPDTVEVFMNGDRVNAGGDQIVCNDDNKASLSGSPINANNTGSLLWTKKTGPGTAVFSAPNNNNTEVTVSDKGVYVFLLTHTLSSPMSCVVEDSVTVEFPDLITPISNDKDSVCLGGDSILLSTMEFIPSRSWNSGNVNMFLGNTSPVSSVINVDSIPYNSIRANSIESVCLNVNHSWVSDVRIRLRAPNGTTQALFNRTGGAGDNFDNVCFVTDPSAPTISSQNGTGTPAYSGNYRALNGVDLNQSFNGIDPNGNWELLLDDDSGPDNGALVNWSITFNTHLDWTSLDADGSEMSSNVGDQIKVLPNSAGKFRYQVKANTPGVLCEEVEEIEITVVDPNFNAGTDTDTCGYEFQLNADDLTAGSTGTWTNGNGNPVAATFANDDDPKSTVTVTQEGVYNFAWTVKMGDCIKYDTVQVTFTTRPVSPEVADQRICDLSTTQLHAPVVGVDTNYHWFREADNPKYQITDTLNVTVTGFAKTYYLKTEYNGCFSLDSTDVDVDYYEKPIISSTVTNLSCNGDASGEIDVHANLAKDNGDTTWVWTGDNGDYTGVNSLGSRTGLNAGFDTVVVTDGNGCMDTAFFEITEPTAISFAANVRQNITCNGDDDGIIEMTYSGGTSNYRIGVFTSPTEGDSILNLAAGDSAIKNLSPGTYTAFVRDANGCYEEVTGLVITEPAPFEIDTIWSSLYPHLTGTNVSCKGGSDDSTVVHLKGGTRPYNYNVLSPSINQTDSIFYALGAGTYDFQFMDNNGCLKDTSNITLTEPSSALASTSTQDSVKCFNGNDGKIIITVNGGTAGYEYRLIAGPGSPTAFQKNDTISNLVAGSYTYEVIDTNGCTITGTQEVFQPDVFEINSYDLSDNNGFNITCNGAEDGFITFHVVGGVRPYTFNKDGGAFSTDSTLTILNAGDHDFRILDAEGLCPIDTTINFTEPSPILVTATQDSVNCFGENNGSITVSVDSDVDGYYYEILGGASGNSTDTFFTFNGLTAGTYTYTAIDDNGCSDTNSIDVREPDTLRFVSALQQTYAGGFNITCKDSATGEITFTISGGTPSYEYRVDGNGYQSSNVFTGLVAGDHTFTVRDKNGCSIDTTINFSEPKLLEATAQQDSVNCFNGNDGEVMIVVDGEVPGFDYNLTGQTTQSTTSNTSTFTSLSAGTYTYSVTDDNGCFVDGSIEVLQPDSFQIIDLNLKDYNGFEISCKDSADGEISIHAIGATRKYTYTTTAPAATAINDSTFSIINAGSHTFTVTDYHGCTVDTIVDFNEPSEFTSDAFQESALCSGDANAKVNLVAISDVTGYLYSIDTKADKFDINDTTEFSGFNAGNYNYSITDDNGCIAEGSITVTEPTPLQIDSVSLSDYYGFNVSCNDSTDGKVELFPTGGTAPYTYTVNSGAFVADSSFETLAATSYTFTVKDNNNCEVDSVITLTEPSPITANAVQDSVSCNGLADGQVTLSVTSDIIGYDYNLDGDIVNEQNDSYTYSGLLAGSYNYSVTDSNGCIATGMVEVLEPEAIFFSGTSLSEFIGGNNISCKDSATGSITTKVIGGTKPYIYRLSGNNNFANQSSNLFNNLVATAGDVLTVEDANGCISDTTIVLTEPSLLTSNSIVDSVNCFGENSGEVQLSGAGSVPGYSFILLDNPQRNNKSGYFDGLVAKAYNYEVTDTNGCVIEASFEVKEPDTLDITDALLKQYIGGNNVSCFGASDGEVTFSVIGGTKPYNYTQLVPFGGSSNSPLISGLSAGSYTFRVTDRNNCLADTGLVFTQPQKLTASAVSTPANCFGESNGTITITAQGGIAAYAYEIIAGPQTRLSQASNVFNGLPSGTYTYKVVDQNGCDFQADVTVNQPDELLIDNVLLDEYIGGKNVSCFGLSDASLEVFASGGNGGYQYQLSGANNSILQNNNKFNNLRAGSTTIRIVDVKSCQATMDTVVSEPEKLELDYVQDSVSCYGLSDGSVNLSLVGGNKDYLQVFEQAGVVLKSSLNSTSSMNVANLTAGAYVYKVTDANGCAESKDVFILEPDSFKIVSATVIPPSCFGFTDDSTSFVLTGGTEVYTYTNNETGVTQKGNSLFTEVGPGTYHYTFTDYNGCTADTTVSIIMPNPLVASATMDSVTCFGKDIGAIYTSANGGNKPYEFSLAGPMNRSPQDDSTFLNLSAGDYQFIVQDSTGCIFTDDIEVTSARQIKLSFTEADTLVCDGGTGFAKFKFTADPDDYEYGINGFVTQKLNANEREFEYLNLEQDGHSVFVQNTDKTCGASIDFVVRKDLVTAGDSFYYNSQFNDDKICKGSPYTVKLINSQGGISWEESFDEGATWEVVTGKKSSKFQLTNIQESRWLRAKLSGVVIEECVEYSQIAKFNVSKSSVSKLEVLLEGNDDFSQNICTNSEYDLTVFSEDGVNNGGIFTWFSSENSNQGIDQNASLNSDSILFYTEEVLSKRYYVEYTDEWMCYALDSIDINTDDALGTEYIEGPNKICLNDSVVLKVRDIKADIQWQEFNANSQAWEDIAFATSSELSVKIDTVKSFRIKGSSSNGVCNYFSEVFEIVPYSEMLPQVDLTVDGISVNDTAICAGTAINVIADASGGKGNLNYFFSGTAIEYTSSPLVNVREFSTNEVANNLMLNVKVRDENGCESTDSILINNLEIPVQGVLSANDSLCNGDTGLIWIHDYSSESIQWQRYNSQLKAWENLDNGSSDTISVSEINNTKYRVLQITGVCSLYTAEFDYHVLPFGNFDFDLSFDNQFIDSASICVGELGLIELSDFESNGGNQFTWNTGANIEDSQNSNQFNFIADSVGIFENILVVTDQFGCSGSDTLVVTVDSQVEVGKITSDHFIACGGEEYTLSVSDVVGEIEWQKFDEFSQSWVLANETDSVLTNTSDNPFTRFRVSVKNGACEVLSKPFSQNISANEKPAVRIEYLEEDAGDTLVVCNLQELELGSKVNSTMPIVNTWNSNSLIILSGSNKEKVKVKAGADSDQALVLITQDFDGCIGVDTLIIKSIDNDFAGDIVSQDVIACEGEEVILTQNNSVGTSVLYKLPDVKITSSTSGEFNYTPTREDTVLYLVNTLGACSDTSSFYVLQLKDVIDTIEIISANGLVICEDAPSLLSTNKESGELVWSTGETTDEIGVRDLEQVSVVYTDANACGVSYDTISLFLAKNVKPYLVWDQKPLATVCGNDFVKVSVEAEVDISSLERSWNGIGQQNTSDYEVKGEEDVFVIIKLGSCEIYSDTVSFIASDYPDLPNINSSTGGAVVCEGDSVELSVLDAPFVFWNNDETDTINPVVTRDTSLYAYVKNEAGCITQSEEFKVDFFPRPEKPTVFSPTGTFNFCDGDVLNLYHDAKVGYWMDNPRLGKTTFGVDSTSVVTVTAINSFGCKQRSDKYSVVLRENPKQPVISSKTGKYEFCDGDTLELFAENHEGEYIAWMGDSLSNTIDFSVTEDLAVYLRYYDSTGTCFSETDQVIVYKRANPEKPTISIQNEFIETQASGDEIKWFNLNVGLLDNDNQVQLQPFSSGDYYVRYINDYECYSNSDTVNYIYLSINNVSNSNLSVYPNPVSVNGSITIEGVKLNKDQPVVLTDASGKRIILSKVNQNTFRIENVAKAVYTLTCFDVNNQKYITRLIVE